MSTTLDGRIDQMPKNSAGRIVTNWSAALEHGEYEADKQLVITDGIRAVEQTAAGHTVNLVTPAVWGDPEQYLTPLLKQKFGEQLQVKYIDQCGCGGFVLRVWV